MHCPSCGNANPDGAKFCMSCGTKLALACPSCGTELPPGAKFCFNCGHQLGAAPPPPPPAAPPAAEPAGPDLQKYIPKALLDRLSAAQAGGGMQGERRVVTMLFCDVKGSTAAAEHLDPEEWADIMNGAFEKLIAPVYRYEGTLARLMGDAILAFFGAPIAHEDDPERAVLAALDIVQEIRPFIRKVRSEWGIDFDVRVGINTGLVVVGNVGSDLRIEYTAMGDAVNLAARMEQTARPGTVQIAEATWKSVQQLFEFDPIGEIEVKGKTEPVRAWRVLGPKERPASERGIAGLEAPMIGRDPELQRLRAAFEGLRGGNGAIVGVIAEAGLGKSRLIAEWRKSLAAAGRLDGVHWHEGRSLSYETGEPYAPFKAIFRGLLALPAEDPGYARVRDAVAPFFPDDPDAVAAPIASLLGLQLDGDAAHRVRYLQAHDLSTKVTEAVVGVIAAFASHRPTVIVLEDLHWADSASLALAHQLQELADRAMVLLVALFRPRQDEASWQFHAHAEQDHPHRYAAIRLSPLPDDDARALVNNLLKIDGLPTRVRDLILERAEGNPFFVEEVIRTLLDGGLVVRDGETWRATAEIEAIEVPETLTGVLTTRLDKLDDAHRRVAQVASVIGREFDFATLAAVAPDPVVLNPALSELQRRGILREVGRIPVRRFRFKHGLTRDAAYDTLLLKHRRQIHVAVAETWERAGADRGAEIATHFLEGRQVERALPYAVDAGDRAASAFAVKEAIRWYRTALEHLDPERHAQLARRAWEGLYTAARGSYDLDGAIEASEALIALGREIRDAGVEISGMNKKAFAIGMFQGQVAEGVALLAQAEEKAKAGDDQVGLLECSMYQCYLQTGEGKFDNVAHYMRQVSDTADAIGADDPKLFGMAHLAGALLGVTRFDEALAQARDTIAISERMGNRFWVSEMLCSVMPLCHLRAGEVTEAVALVRKGIGMATEIGADGDATMGNSALAQISLRLGEFDDALAAADRMHEHAARTGAPFMLSIAECFIGTALVAIGGRALGARASVWHQKAWASMSQPTGSIWTTRLCAEIGHCALAQGDNQVAGQMFEMALTVPNAGMYLYRPDALLGRSLVALRDGRLDDATAALRECETYVRQRDMRHVEPDLAEVSMRLAHARGDLEGARAHVDRAEHAARQLGFRPALARLLSSKAAIARAAGDREVADAAVDEARALVAALAERTSDPEVRSGFERHMAALLADPSAVPVS